MRARAGAGWAGGRVGRAGGRGRGGQGRVWTSKSHWLRVYGLWFRVYGLVFRYLLRVRSVAFGTGPVRRVWRPMRLPCIDKACLVSTRSLASHAANLWVRRSLGLCLRHSNSRQSHKMTPRPPPCSQPMHLCVRVNRE